MSHKKSPEDRGFAIAGTVKKVTKEKIERRAKQEGITVASCVGMVLNEWAESVPGGVEVDERQEVLPLVEGEV